MAVLALTMALCGPLTPTVGASAAASDTAGFITLLFSRSAITTAENCVTDSTNVKPLITGVAPELKRRGFIGTGTVETRFIKESSRVCGHFRRTSYASWSDLTNLRVNYHWQFVSHSRTYEMHLDQLTRQQQWDETCGSILDLLAHGHRRGDGLFAYPHSSGVLSVQTQVVSKCFAFSRRYKWGPISRAEATTSPYWNNTMQTGGGRCNNPTLACYKDSRLDAARYANPYQLAHVASGVVRAQWLTIQSYVLVTGTRSGEWDCRSSDWRDHWTADFERYCWSDYLKVLNAIPATVKVTDPKTVALAWGRTNYTPPALP